MSRRTWLFIGAVFGLAVPFVLNLVQRFGPWHVRPCTHYLFRPGMFFLAPLYYLLCRSQDSPMCRLVDSPLILWPLILACNAAVFGAAAYGLRRGFLAVITFLLILNFVLLPPSDAKLERQFAASKPDFERLIQLADQTPTITRIAYSEIESSDGKKYQKDDSKAPLSPESWNEYRSLFTRTGMKEGLSRSPETGQISFWTHSVLGKLEPFGPLYGYAYCPEASHALPALVPCTLKANQYDIGDVRYKRIGPEWFIVEVFNTRSTIN